MRRSGGKGQKRGIRSRLAASCLAVGLALIAAAPATASTWDVRQLGGEASKVAMFGISCPSSSLCVAVGGNNAIASSSDPTGGAGSWDVVYAGSGALSVEGAGFFNGRQIRGVSCPSPQLCVAVTFEGQIYTATEPAGSAAAWTVTDLDPEGPNTHLYGISCPTVSFCAASASGAKVVTSTNPTGGTGAWSTTQLQGPLELRGVSCASPRLCTLVGDDGEKITPQISDQGVGLASTEPLGGSWQRAQVPAQGSMYGVACPTEAFCVSGDLLGNLLVSTSPTGAWRSVDGGGSVQITDVDCLSDSRCVAIDNNGDILTSVDPNGDPGDWTFTNVLPYPGVDETEANAMFGVSCPTTTLCAVAGNKGQIFTSTDPFLAPPPPSSGPPAAGKGKRRPKRPRTTIALRPQPRIELVGKKVPARFRFFARNHVQVGGFVCKFDQGPFRRCHSPKTYRTGLGRHVFRVRAVGWTGLRGPVEVRRFRVCRPTPYLPCMKHLPPPAAG